MHLHTDCNTLLKAKIFSLLQLNLVRMQCSNPKYPSHLAPWPWFYTWIMWSLFLQKSEQSPYELILEQWISVTAWQCQRQKTIFWWALQQLCNLHLGAFSAAIRSNKLCDAKKILLHWVQETNWWGKKIIHLLHYALFSENNPKFPLRTVQRSYQRFSEHLKLHHLAVISHFECNSVCYIWNSCKHPANKSKSTPSSSARKLLRR